MKDIKEKDCITDKKNYQKLLQKLKSETDNLPLHSRKVVKISQKLDNYIVNYMKKYTAYVPESQQD